MVTSSITDEGNCPEKPLASVQKTFGCRVHEPGVRIRAHDFMVNAWGFIHEWER